MCQRLCECEMQNLHSLQGIKKKEEDFSKIECGGRVILCLNSIPRTHSYSVCIMELKASL